MVFSLFFSLLFYVFLLPHSYHGRLEVSHELSLGGGGSCKCGSII